MVHSLATLGGEVPVWDAQTSFGDTDLLVSNVAMGLGLARLPSAIGIASSVRPRFYGCRQINT